MLRNKKHHSNVFPKKTKTCHYQSLFYRVIPGEQVHVTQH